ncbi:MAG: pantetheine-phosphate adenylyltransferase [Succinivibrio sp.]
MNTLAVFPGTFDPLTLGHMDIISRSAKIFDSVMIAVAKSPSKHTLFDLDTRVKLTEKSVSHLNNVTVKGFDGMLIDFLKENNANILIRGVRTVADYDYETQLSGMYRLSMPELEVVLLPTNSTVSFISSTLVREVIIHGGDIKKFVPEPVFSYVLNAK